MKNVHYSPPQQGTNIEPIQPTRDMTLREEVEAILAPTLKALEIESKEWVMKDVPDQIIEAFNKIVPEKKQMDFVKNNPTVTQNDEDRCRFYRYGGYDFAINQIERAINKP